MPLTKPEHRWVLSSKIGLSRFCKKNNIPCPGYQVYGKESDCEKIKNDLRFPVVIKADFGWGGDGMFISETYDTFVRAIHKLPVHKHVLVQEYIEGTEFPVEALFSNGKLLMYQTSSIRKFSGHRFSFTTQRDYFPCPDLKDYLEDLGEKLGLNGFTSIGYMFDPRDGTYNLIEVDMRPNSWTAMGRFLSPDLLDAIRYLSEKNPAVPFQQKGMKNKTKHLALFYKDFRRAYWEKDWKTVVWWIFDVKGFWRYIPFYDSKLLRKVTFSIFNEIFLAYKAKYFPRKTKP
ncbi:ATP-grasp domain-containing protein [Niabella soli]|nr:ATP-grasp domain-containing protein [Niabella soli]